MTIKDRLSKHLRKADAYISYELLLLLGLVICFIISQTISLSGSQIKFLIRIGALILCGLYLAYDSFSPKKGHSSVDEKKN